MKLSRSNGGWRQHELAGQIKRARPCDDSALRFGNHAGHERCSNVAGHQIDQVQKGMEPDDWKPMPTIGHGVREIRIRDASGAFRVVYVAKFADAIYVLHCFQKKPQRTSKGDLELAECRYRDLLKELKR